MFERGDGNDRITDFRNGVDVLDLDDFSRAQIEAVINSARVVGEDDLLLTLSANTTIRLDNFALSDLDRSDFI